MLQTQLPGPMQPHAAAGSAEAATTDTAEQQDLYHRA